MVVINPISLSLGEKGLIEKIAAEGHHGYVFEAYVGLFAEVVLGVDFAGHYHVCKGKDGLARV